MTSLDMFHRSLQNGILLGATSAGISWLLGSVGPGTCTSFISVCAFTTLVSFLIFSLKVSLEGRAILITGCDTGFGNALALKLDKMGCHVFAGCLLADSSGEGAKLLREQGSSRLHVLQMDVTSPEQINRAVNEIKAKIPKDQPGLWGLINNAGLALYGELEWLQESEYTRSFDINVTGAVRVTKAVLPSLRRAKGRIVNLTSGLGRFCVPLRSPYCASKYGLEAVSDCLRYEMRPWGVHVSIVEPGNFILATGIFTEEKVREQADNLWKYIPDNVKEDYGRERFDKRVNQMISFTSAGESSMEPVLESLICGLSHRYPLPRYQPQDWYYKVRTLSATHLPEWLYEKIYMNPDDCGTLFT